MGQVLVLPVPRGFSEDAKTESVVATGAQGCNYVSQVRGTGGTVLLGLQCREKLQLGKFWLKRSLSHP